MIPAGYDPSGLVPIVIISDADGVEQYRFEHVHAISAVLGSFQSSGGAFQTAGNAFQTGGGIPVPIQDFPMIGYHLHRGVGADLGRLVITLDDKDNNWTDTTDRRRPSKFQPLWKIDFFMFLAGDASNPTPDTAKASLDQTKLWFSGFIMDPQVERPVNNYQRQTLFCVGNALELTERLTSIKVTQDRAADGVDFDSTSPLTALSIMTDLITKSYHFPHTGLVALVNFNVNEVTSSSLITFGDFQTHYYTVHQAITEVAQRAGYVWGVRPDGTIFMFPRGTQDSGLLFTNNLSDSITTGWDVSKMCILRNVPTGYTDSGAGVGFSILHGVGGVQDFLLSEQTASDASLDMSADAEFGFPFIATEDSVSRIAIFGDIQSGPATLPLHMCIFSDDGASVVSTGSVRLDSGASGSVDGITVNSVQIMSGAEAFDTDLRTTADNVAGNINEFTSVPNYRATVAIDGGTGDPVINIHSLIPGEITNGYTVASSATTIVTVDSPMAGGVLGRPSFDLKRRIKVESEQLDAEFPASGGWLETSVQTVNSGTTLTPLQVSWLVIGGHPDVRLDYQTTIGQFARNRGAVDDRKWRADTTLDKGSLKMRIHHSHSIDVIVENTVAKKTFGTREVLLPIHDFPTGEAAFNGLVGFSEVTSRAQRVYQPVQATPPLKPPQLGKTARMIDKFNGMDTIVDIIGYDIQATSFTKWNRGVDSMTFHFEEVFFPT
jgi:hypothetical protein